MPRPFILASASPARLAVLRGAGLKPDVFVTGAPEDDVDSQDPAEVVTTLARRKAENAAARLPADALILGCDSVLAFDGEIWGKPVDVDQVLERWQRLRGREGVLWTGHCLIDTATNESVDEASSTVVRFGNPDLHELEALVETGEPLAVAGGFTIDGYASAFVDGISGDHGTVLGLSMPVLRRLLISINEDLTAQWH